MKQYFTELQKMLRVAVLGAAVTLAACASSNSGDYADIDPFEGTNRAVLSFNEAVDQNVLEPTARGYRAVVPSGLRIGLRNFLRNLRSPVDFGNQVLQADVEGATNQVFRTFVNTTAGFGGVVDVAAMGGVEYEPEDFGQTLATWGIDHGAYLIVPILGPSSIRDSVGTAVDSFADPLRLYAFNIDEEHLHYTRVGLAALDKREELLEVIEDLRNNSIDYYAALRSAYIQNRAAQVNDQGGDAAAVIPDYDTY